MSRSRFLASFFIDGLASGFHGGAEIGIANHPFGEQIHLAAKQPFQCFRKFQKCIRVTGIARARELHDEIEIAPFGLKVAARRRAKKIKPPNLVLSA